MPRDMRALAHTTAEPQGLGRRAVARLFGLLWPADDLGLRRRLVATALLLAGAALLNALVPLLFAPRSTSFPALPPSLPPPLRSSWPMSASTGSAS